jgi:hypothetical protein
MIFKCDNYKKPIFYQIISLKYSTVKPLYNKVQGTGKLFC